jgi:hypothetical protein
MLLGGGSTKEQASNDPHDFVLIPGQGIESTERKKPWDIGFYCYQDFWQAEGDPNRKANFMIGGTVGPDNPLFAQWNLFGNVEVFGAIKSRSNDRIGVAGWFNGLSDNFMDLTSPVIELRDTWGFEAYYAFAINKWLLLSADLQLIENAREKDDFAVIPGARLVIDF